MSIGEAAKPSVFCCADVAVYIGEATKPRVFCHADVAVSIGEAAKPSVFWCGDVAVSSVFCCGDVAASIGEAAKLSCVLHWRGSRVYRGSCNTLVCFAAETWLCLSADKALWQMIHDLVLDQHFTLDNAIHEVTRLRLDMASLLQPRPKLSTRTQQPSTSAPSTGSAKGRGKSKSKSKQGGKKGDSSSRPTWVTEATVQSAVYAVSVWQVPERRYLSIQSFVCPSIGIGTSLWSAA